MSNKSVAEQMAEILEDVKSGAEEALTAGLKVVSKTTPAKLRSESPKRYGEYAKGWRVLKPDKKTVIVYNAKKPGLTHLLENGHVIRNKNGSYGRAKAIKHIAPVNQEEQQAFFDTTMAALDREL